MNKEIHVGYAITHGDFGYSLVLYKQEDIQEPYVQEQIYEGNAKVIAQNSFFITGVKSIPEVYLSNDVRVGILSKMVSDITLEEKEIDTQTLETMVNGTHSKKELAANSC